jgi:hypothetical protein
MLCWRGREPKSDDLNLKAAPAYRVDLDCPKREISVHASVYSLGEFGR